MSEEEEEEEEDAPPSPAAAAAPTDFFGIAFLKGVLCAVRDAELLVLLLLETRKPCFVREDAISTTRSLSLPRRCRTRGGNKQSE